MGWHTMSEDGTADGYSVYEMDALLTKLKRCSKTGIEEFCHRINRMGDDDVNLLSSSKLDLSVSPYYQYAENLLSDLTLPIFRGQTNSEWGLKSREKRLSEKDKMSVIIQRCKT